MPGEEESIRVASEWWGRSKISSEQREKKRKTGSYYNKDRVVEPYSFSKGEYV